jgi:hypothetical protein
MSGICDGVKRSFVMSFEINPPVGCKTIGDIRKVGFYPVAMDRM